MPGSWRRPGCEALFVGTGGVVGAYTGLADVGTATMTECVHDRRLDRRQRVDPGDHGRRHRSRRHHGGAPHGAGMHPRRHCRHPHRRPADRRQAQDAERRRRGRAARPGDRALPRRGRHEERARPEFRRDGAVLRARCLERRTLEDTIARLRAYREEAGVDWVQFESPHSIDEIRAGARSRDGAVFLHERQARPLSRSRRASGARRHHRLVSRFHAPRHLGGAVGLHDRVPVRAASQAWDDFVDSRRRTGPTRCPKCRPDGEGGDKQQALEQRYLSSAARRNTESQAALS